MLGAAVAPADAQTAAAESFAIVDNSFLVEEAFNQEPGIFQNIFGLHAADGDWEASFTQEWPVRSQLHQFSYTMPVASLSPHTGVGDVLVNYRYQALLERPGVPAFSPRVSLILPTGSEERGLGSGSWGWQVNLPFSKQRGDVFFHWNAGFTLVPRALGAGDARVNLFSPHLAASAIYRVRPMLNVMLEGVAQFEEIPDGPGTSRESVYTLAPGLRGGWNLQDHQMIVGVAIPVQMTGETTNTGAFFYLSYELPFKR
jgi:hypothetical protein